IIIHVPHSDAGQGEQAYGHVIITGITPQEFTAATGEPVQGTIPESGIPELRDPNDQASFRHVSELFAFLGLIGFTEAGTLFETFLSYLFPDFEQDEDDEFEILCLFTPNDDIVDFDDVTDMGYDPSCFYHALEGDDLVWMPSDTTEAAEAGY